MDISESGDLQLNESQKLMEPYWEFRRNLLARDQAAGKLDPEIIDQETGRIENETKQFNDWLVANKKKESNTSSILEDAAKQQSLQS